MTSLTFDDLQRLRAIATGDEKHAASTTSTLDVLWVLYDRVLNISASHPDDPMRDRFVLSKGHGPTSYYAVLAAKGFIDPADLSGFTSWGSSLGFHPDRLVIPGVEVSSGSLGHGLPIAVGIALALRVRHGSASPRVICLIGDGESDEGSIHEAIAFAGRAHLDNLRVIAIDNDSSRWGWPGGLGSRFKVEGWRTSACESQDHDLLAKALDRDRSGVPEVIVVDTKGVY